MRRAKNTTGDRKSRGIREREAKKEGGEEGRGKRSDVRRIRKKEVIRRQEEREEGRGGGRSEEIKGG